MAKLNATCRPYEAKLNRVPVPSFSDLAAVARSMDRVLPVMKGELAAARTLRPPPAVAEAVRRIFRNSAASIVSLEQLRAAARKGDRAGAKAAVARFLRSRNASRAQADALGITC